MRQVGRNVIGVGHYNRRASFKLPIPQVVDEPDTTGSRVAVSDVIKPVTVVVCNCQALHTSRREDDWVPIKFCEGCFGLKWHNRIVIHDRHTAICFKDQFLKAINCPTRPIGTCGFIADVGFAIQLCANSRTRIFGSCYIAQIVTPARQPGDINQRRLPEGHFVAQERIRVALGVHPRVPTRRVVDDQAAKRDTCGQIFGKAGIGADGNVSGYYRFGIRRRRIVSQRELLILAERAVGGQLISLAQVAFKQG